MSVIPCHRGGHHCRWPACPLDCDGRPAMTHCVINGTHYVRTGPNTWAPDYSKPDTAERVKRSVDDAYNANWSIDRWRR